MLSKPTQCAGLLFTFFLANSLGAETVRIANWKYYKVIQKPTKVMPAGSHLATIELDSAIMQHSHYDDLRIISQQRDYPYFIRKKTAAMDSYQSVGFKLLYQKKQRDSYESLYQLDAVELPLIRLQFRIPSSFEGSLSLQSGPQPDQMSYLGSQSLFAYDNQNRQDAVIVNLPRNHRYVRLHLNQDQVVLLARLQALQKNPDMQHQLSPEESSHSISENTDTQSTFIDLPNPYRRPISRIELDFADERFDRRLAVRQYDSESKSWLGSFYTRISAMGSNQGSQVINLPYPIHSRVRLVIDNESNAALELQDLRVWSPRMEMVLELPDYEKSAQDAELRLYYGNPYAPQAEYDLQSTFDSELSENVSLPELQLGKELANPDYSWSLLEPPLSIWLIRILLILGALLSIWPTWKILRKPTEPDER